MLKSCCALLFLLFPCAAAAQYPGDEYYPYAEREERRELLTTDSTIFYRAVQSPSDLYGLRTGFNLPQVALRRRGLDYTLERTSLMGVAVSYRYLAALRLLGAEEQRYAGACRRARGAGCGGRHAGVPVFGRGAVAAFSGFGPLHRPQLPRGSESRRLGVARATAGAFRRLSTPAPAATCTSKGSSPMP